MSYPDPMHGTQAEKILEVSLLKAVKICIAKGMPIENVLSALERVCHTVTEIKLELDADENQNKF